MFGNSREGIHNLRIENIKMEDDGDYQCQVGPALNHKAIRAHTKLTVLLKPTSIDIIGHSNGTTVEVKESDKLNLQCLVFGGKPKAEIKWFRKNIEQRTEKSDADKDDTDNNGSKGESETQTHELGVTKSTITLTPHAEDNGVTYSCEAHHPALSTPLRKTVTLSVLYPAGQPEISGFTDGETVRMGDTVTLVCRSRGGNPLAQLVWKKNGEQVDFSYTTVAGRESINSYSFIVDASDNNAVYSFAPAKVTITGPAEAKAGENVTMTCKTDKSNPAAELSWVVDGRPLIAKNVVTVASAGGWVTSANVTIAITNQDRNMKMFSCYAVNQALGETIVETSVLSVLSGNNYMLHCLDPPDAPSIFGYSESSSIRAGSLQRLTCVVHGGNPLPELKWFKENEEIKTGSTSSINGNVVTNELTIVTKDADNGALYRCEAHSSAITNKSLENSVRLTVLFPPLNVNIQMKPKVPKAGSKVDLICESGSSNPESEINWFRNGLPVSGRRDGVFGAPFGGTATRNILTMNVTSEDNGAVYTCQATNQGLGSSVHDAVTLNVLYKPEFTNLPFTQFDLIEGDSTSVNLTAIGNPSVIEYKWSRDGLDFDKKRFRSDGPVLNISSVLRNDSGIYKCLAFNDQGASESSIIVNVHYPVSIEIVTETVLVEQGKNAYLVCQVNANPNVTDAIIWKRRRNITSSAEEQNFEDISSSRTRQTFEANRSFLIISNVSQEDSGGYECSAFNGIGNPASAIAYLIVKQKPIINRFPSVSKAASDNGSVGKLVCRADGAPNVTFTWSREGSVISNSDNKKPKSEKYIVETTSHLSLITFQSILLIKDVSNSDYGSYKCIARNELGFDVVDINFSRTSAPDPPIALRIINSTSNSVTLKWVPGFDGGQTQSFRIRFKEVSGSDSFQYRDLSPKNITQFLVTGLKPATEYAFNVMAFNDIAESKYTEDIVKTVTQSETPASETEKVISQVLSGKAGDIPRIIIIVVTIFGSALLVLNIILVICFVRRRRKKRFEEESDQSSTAKTGTIEMYAPASGSGGSYNNGITETSLSGSDEENKSEGAYSGKTDYAMEISPSGMVTTHHHGISTYLIDDTIASQTNYYPPRFANYGIIIAQLFVKLSIHAHSQHPMKNEYNEHLATSEASLSAAIAASAMSDQK
ncbi:nephrin-like protein, partial [Leptotrombidium deliense]